MAKKKYYKHKKGSLWIVEVETKFAMTCYVEGNSFLKDGHTRFEWISHYWDELTKEEYVKYKLLGYIE